MLYLKFHLIFYLFAGIVASGVWIHHKRKHTPLIKYKPKSEVQRIKQEKLGKKFDLLCAAGLLLFWILNGIPYALDLPYAMTGNLKEAAGIVTGGDMSAAESNANRMISILDAATGEEICIHYYGEGTPRNSVAVARYLPHSKQGYIVSSSE